MTEELSLDEVIKSFILEDRAALYTAIPGKIISYDHEQQKASVQPTISRILQNGDVITPSQISGVPVMFPSGNNSSLTFPIKPNDKVLLLFSQRSIDQWVFGEGEEPIDPRDRRKHSSSDCIAIPGLYPYKKAWGGDPDQVVIRHNASVNNQASVNEHSIHLHPSGDTEAIRILANKGTSQPVSIVINQDGTIVIDTPSSITVNCESADVNSSGLVTVDGSQIHLNGSGGGVLTQESINPLTGVPFPDGSSTVKAGDG